MSLSLYLCMIKLNLYVCFNFAVLMIDTVLAFYTFYRIQKMCSSGNVVNKNLFHNVCSYMHMKSYTTKIVYIWCHGIKV